MFVMLLIEWGSEPEAGKRVRAGCRLMGARTGKLSEVIAGKNHFSVYLILCIEEGRICEDGHGLCLF